ncbi:MAG: 2-hydroxyacid dehydrogenase [Bdellovibrionales bacterium]|nr:2-hydroxyacid dehydrogenase [Bdellovibrionales bacterium]
MVKVAVFDIHEFEKNLFVDINRNKFQFELTFFDVRLTPKTAKLAYGFDVVVAFANDLLNAETIDILAGQSVRLIALRCAGHNQVDVPHAKKLNIPVVRVPAYSPYAVAEFAVALLLTLNRKIHRSYHRSREMNFSLNGLVGFDLHGKTVGIIGTGTIGSVFAKIMHGFGVKLLAYDSRKSLDLVDSYSLTYVTLEELLSHSDIVSLHVPLNQMTKHMINSETIFKMKKGAYLVNTGRGALINTSSLIEALKTGHLGAAALDVYEEEEKFFFQDHSGDIIQDDQLARLISFPNVIVTSHQAFLTTEALRNIITTTLENIGEYEQGKTLTNRVIVS